MNGLTELEQRANDEARHAHRELADQADARVAAAYEAAADVLLDRGTNVEDPIAVRKDILALTPDDAQAALDRLIAAARHAHRELVEAYEAKLAKAEARLEKLARLGNGDRYGNSEGNLIARAALAELKGKGDE